MRLRGKHALEVLTLEDALGKLSTGSMTQEDFAKFQSLVTQLQGAVALPSNLFPPLVLPVPTPKVK